MSMASALSSRPHCSRKVCMSSAGAREAAGGKPPPKPPPKACAAVGAPLDMPLPPGSWTDFRKPWKSLLTSRVPGFGWKSDITFAAEAASICIRTACASASSPHCSAKAWRANGSAPGAAPGWPPSSWAIAASNSAWACRAAFSVAACRACRACTDARPPPAACWAGDPAQGASANWAWPPAWDLRKPWKSLFTSRVPGFGTKAEITFAWTAGSHCRSAAWLASSRPHCSAKSCTMAAASPLSWEAPKPAEPAPGACRCGKREVRSERTKPWMSLLMSLVPGFGENSASTRS
mmetsp:Transcript_29216/g.64266  ORF Transcript_29216/g.64266 Transcript_29216/m.64266 type:complete len:292 (+) Transcript_29216:685-1560(+)